MEVKVVATASSLVLVELDVPIFNKIHMLNRYIHIYLDSSFSID